MKKKSKRMTLKQFNNAKKRIMNRAKCKGYVKGKSKTFVLWADKNYMQLTDNDKIRILLERYENCICSSRKYKGDVKVKVTIEEI